MVERKPNTVVQNESVIPICGYKVNIPPCGVIKLKDVIGFKSFVKLLDLISKDGITFLVSCESLDEVEGILNECGVCSYTLDIVKD